MTALRHLDQETARRVLAQGMERLGYLLADASYIAQHLIEAEACGLHALGLSRALQIERHLTNGGARGNRWVLVKETAVSVQIDAQGGIGYLAVRDALALGIDKCGQHGMCAVAVRNTFFTGALRYYAREAAQSGLVALIASSAAPASAAAPGGIRPVLGTNPIAFGAPGLNEPLVYDAGTTPLTWSELERRALRDESLPPDCAIDGRGLPTTSARAAMEGALLHWGGARGYGLATVVQALGILAGAPAVAAGLSDCGFCAILVDPALFDNVRPFQAEMEDFREAVHDSGRRSGAESSPRLPGERDAALLRSAAECGFDAQAELLDQLTQIGSR